MLLYQDIFQAACAFDLSRVRCTNNPQILSAVTMACQPYASAFTNPSALRRSADRPSALWYAVPHQPWVPKLG